MDDSIRTARALLRMARWLMAGDERKREWGGPLVMAVLEKFREKSVRDSPVVKNNGTGRFCVERRTEEEYLGRPVAAVSCVMRVALLGACMVRLSAGDFYMDRFDETGYGDWTLGQIDPAAFNIMVPEETFMAGSDEENAAALRAYWARLDTALGRLLRKAA